MGTFIDELSVQGSNPVSCGQIVNFGNNFVRSCRSLSKKSWIAGAYRGRKDGITLRRYPSHAETMTYAVIIAQQIDFKVSIENKVVITRL